VLPPFVNIYKRNSNQTFNNASFGSQHELRIFYDVVGGRDGMAVCTCTDNSRSLIDQLYVSAKVFYKIDLYRV